MFLFDDELALITEGANLAVIGCVIANYFFPALSGAAIGDGPSPAPGSNGYDIGKEEVCLLAFPFTLGSPKYVTSFVNVPVLQPVVPGMFRRLK